MTFIVTPRHAAIFDAIKSGQNVMVQAVAGSGKTTTMLESMKTIDSNKSVAFLAFNKSIAEELKTKVPGFVKAATFHSLGMGALLKLQGRTAVDGQKCQKIIRAMIEDRFVGEEAANAKRIYGGFVPKLISLAKGSGVGLTGFQPLEASSFQALIKHHDLDLGSEDADMNVAIELAIKGLKRSIELSENSIDFDDMLYMTIHHNASFWRYDMLYIDEAQDTNELQREMVRRMLKDNGQLIAVGDTNQAIYGFRGADSTAMTMLKKEFKMIELPLSVTYRCDAAIVRRAQRIVPHLEARDGAGPGEVIDLGADFRPKEFTHADAVVCRNVKPLISLAFKCYAQQIPCHILGRDIGHGLVKMVELMKAQNLDRLEEKLEIYRVREEKKLIDANRDAAVELLNDKVDCVTTFIKNLDENSRTIPGLVALMNKVFDATTGITLCTIHKSKGLEFKTLYLLNSDLLPSRYAKQDWQKQQEANLEYVAITRAMNKLVYINA
jgi:DNA helicase-2/ATP-dependent DNA helicase PcrA